MDLSEADVARFWKKVIKTPTCWLYGHGSPKSYLHFYYGSKPNKKKLGAHRLSFQLSKGSIGAGLVVDHICCVPRCVNPDHLQLVSRGENVRLGIERKGVGQYGRGCAVHGQSSYQQLSRVSKNRVSYKIWRCDICYKIARRKLEHKKRQALFAEGIFRSRFAVSIFCPNGHRRTKDTVRWAGRGGGAKRLVCRICDADKQKRAGERIRRAKGIPARKRSTQGTKS